MRAPPTWKTRRCATCNRVKPRARFASAYARSCATCRTCPCGEPCARGRRTCMRRACVLEAISATRRRDIQRAADAPRPATRHCAACGLTKPRDLENFALQRKGTPTLAEKWDAWCRPCRRAYNRDRYANDAELRARKQEHVRECKARRDARMELDPEFAAEWQANRAAVNKRYRERGPVAERNSNNRRDDELPRVPTAPLVEALDHIQGRSAMDDTVFSAVLGISDRTLRAWRNGERDTVQLGTVDGVLLRTHLNWHDVYPDDDVLAA